MRKILGSVCLLGFMTAYIGVAALIGARVSSLAWPLQIAFFAVAGFVWVLPLRPLIRWMHQSR